MAARVETVRERRVEPLWDRVDRNRIELAVFIILLIAGSAAASAVLLGIVLLSVMLFIEETVRWAVVFENLPAAFALWCTTAAAGVAVYVALALARCERWLLAKFEARLAPRGELLPTKHALKDMAIAAGFDVAPSLWVIETSNVNAFVFAKGRRRPVVGVTRGLAERLTPDEQRAVFANLMARLRAGDTIWATGVTAIMAPLWTVRDLGLTGREDPSRNPVRALELATEEGVRHIHPYLDARMLLFVAWMFPVATLFVIISEYIAFGHRRSQLRHAEVADAEGMLLLKDPRSMLSALEKCVRFNNFVPTVGPGFTQLFYCWTGDGSTDDEHDPEYRRIMRLREVLGVEGLAEPLLRPTSPVLEPPLLPAVKRSRV